MDADPRATHDEPLVIDVHDGEVVITGPGPIAIALTAQAAAKTAARLATAARKASAHVGDLDNVRHFRSGPT